MARQERIQFPGATYHIMARGNAGEDIFRDDEDRGMFMDLFAKIAEEARWRVHAWCLMRNHFHLYLTTEEANLSASMQRFNGTYCQRFNRRHSRQGHVFQGRYKALLVAGEAYGLQLYRYILANPVEAGIVTHAAGYPWSSARAVLSNRPAAWMDFRSLNPQIKGRLGHKEQALEEFIRQDQRAPLAFEGQIYGDEEDRERLKYKSPLLEDIVRPRLGTFSEQGQPEWVTMARDVVDGKHRGADVARYYGVHRSTLTKAVARYRANLATIQH